MRFHPISGKADIKVPDEGELTTILGMAATTGMADLRCLLRVRIHTISGMADIKVMGENTHNFKHGRHKGACYG